MAVATSRHRIQLLCMDGDYSVILDSVGVRLKGLLLLRYALLSAKPQRTTEAPQPYP